MIGPVLAAESRHHQTESHVCLKPSPRIRTPDRLQVQGTRAHTHSFPVTDEACDRTAVAHMGFSPLGRLPACRCDSIEAMTSRVATASFQQIQYVETDGYRSTVAKRYRVGALLSKHPGKLRTALCTCFPQLQGKAQCLVQAALAMRFGQLQLRNHDDGTRQRKALRHRSKAAMAALSYESRAPAANALSAWRVTALLARRCGGASQARG